MTILSVIFITAVLTWFATKLHQIATDTDYPAEEIHTSYCQGVQDGREYECYLNNITFRAPDYLEKAPFEEWRRQQIRDEWIRINHKDHLKGD